MRILYFTQDYTPHDHRFLSSLAGSGHQVYSLRLEQRGPQRESRALPPEVEQVQWTGGRAPADLSRYPALLADLRRVIRRINPDVIHAGPIQSSAFLAAAAGFRPLVSMSWGSDLLVGADSSSWMRFATRYTLKRTTVLVGDCQAVRDKAVSLGFPAERVVLFPWGIDLDHFAPEEPVSTAPDLRERLGWQDNFTLLSLRSWEPIYGVDVLLRAFIQASQQHPDLRLFMLGTGSMAPMLQQMIERGGVRDCVYLGGQTKYSNLPRFYRAADLYVSASHSDGSSVSLMEALGCGRPVLVSDIPGNQEWITPGEQGWLFRDGDVDSLTAGILNAVRERKRLPEMGRAARSLAEQRADWNRNFQQLLHAYDLAVSTAKSGKKR